MSSRMIRRPFEEIEFMGRNDYRLGSLLLSKIVARSNALRNGHVLFLVASFVVVMPLCGDSAVVAHAQNSESPITSVSRGAVALVVPKGVPAGQSWHYGLAMPLQLDAKTAGLLVNIRRNGTPYGDFEIGNDLIPFTDLRKIDARKAVAISRSMPDRHPTTGDASIIAKYPLLGGFVPGGAKRADGSAHPYAGTGFGIAQICFFPADFTKPLPNEDQLGYRLELYQFRYRNGKFNSSPPVRFNPFLPVGDDGWAINSPGLSPAIGDGDDLLFAVTCSKPGGEIVTGVARLQHTSMGWQPKSFIPVTDPHDPTWFEPSLVRDTDGSLLFSARNHHQQGIGDIALWRSSDGGQTWEQMFRLAGARTGTPIVLNPTATGTPYFATNMALGTDRNTIHVVPLNSTRSELLAPLIARDGIADFGPSPSGDGWKVDHGIGAVVHLADNRWHSLLVYRVLDQGENYGKPVTRHTGCFLEEIFSPGNPQGVWEF